MVVIPHLLVYEKPPKALHAPYPDHSTDHLVYGLHLRSNQPIPGLAALPVALRADVQVWLGSLPQWKDDVLAAAQSWYVAPERDESGELLLRAWRIADGQYFRLLYADGTEFVLDRRGTQVWAVWPESLTVEDTATYLLGPVLGFLLRLRGVTCLHASAVAMGDRAVALLGPAGAGKSTTAAAFAQSGHRVLSDDVAALGECGEDFLVQPAYPRVRLWPSSVSILYGAGDALPRLTPTWDKRYLDLYADGARFQEQPLPLAAVYILGERCDRPTAPYVEAVSSNEALMSLVANTYTSYLLDKAMRAREFRTLGRVLKRVPVRRVVPHADPSRLSRLCAVIRDDFTR